MYSYSVKNKEVGGILEPVQVKQKIKYQRLVVPERMRSVYWKYFGFPATIDNKIITKDAIVCMICNTQMVYNRNTSNLRMHLISKHRDVLRKDSYIDVEQDVLKIQKNHKNFKKNTTRKVKEESNVHTICQPLEGSYISDISIVYPENPMSNKGEMSLVEVREIDDSLVDGIVTDDGEITSTIVNFLINDLMSPNIVNGKGFTNLISVLRGKGAVAVPTSEDIVKHLSLMHNVHKEGVANNLDRNSLSNISLSVEEWTSADNVRCLSFYMHYLKTDTPKLLTNILTTTFCTGTENALYWKDFILNLMNGWCISTTMVIAIVVACNSEALKCALSEVGFVVIPCFMHLIQKVCTEHCFSDSTVSSILEKCRSIVYYNRGRKNFSEDDSMDMETSGDDAQENEINSLSPDNPNLWFTTFNMIRDICNKKTIISCSIIPPDENSGLKLLAHEWESLGHLVEFLEPLNDIYKTILEGNCLISLVDPLLHKKVDTLLSTKPSSEPPLISKLKTNIKTAIRKAYSAPEIGTVIHTATILDPRFKIFVNDLYDSLNLDDFLTGALNDPSLLIETSGSDMPSSKASASSQSLTKKTSNRSSIYSLFGDFGIDKKPAISKEAKIKTEIMHYKSEENIALDECPLQWWQSMQNKCPNLHKLAMKYHSVPSIVLWSNSELSLEEYYEQYTKRSLIQSSYVDSLLFLHCNKFGNE